MIPVTSKGWQLPPCAPSRWPLGLLLVAALACVKPTPPSLEQQAQPALERGAWGRLIQLIPPDAPPPLETWRLIALSESHRWHEIEPRLPQLSPADQPPFRCLSLARAQDIRALHACHQARERPIADPHLADATQRALATAYHYESLPQEAANTLEALTQQSPRPVNFRALVDHYEKQGDLVAALSSLSRWMDRDPDPSLQTQRLRLLDRKLRGDLFFENGPEAEKTARLLLKLRPTQHNQLYFLADALRLQGRDSEARALEKEAEAQGATRPPPVNLPAPPTPHRANHAP